jgi:hypothetical protein
MTSYQDRISLASFVFTKLFFNTLSRMILVSRMGMLVYMLLCQAKLTCYLS